MSGTRSGIRHVIAVVVSMAFASAGAAPAPAPQDDPAKAKAESPAQPQPPQKPEQPAPAPEQDPEPVRSMKAWLAGLADRDPQVREQSRIKLMGMERRNLPAFQKVVERSRPLRPAQAVALREIVTHVYLAGEPYDANETQGFLGVKLQPTVLVQADGLIARPSSNGVVIVERMPGFAGARMLRDGDVILTIAELQERLPLIGSDEFSMAVRDLGPGRLVQFEVLREGQVVRIPITLDPRPLEANGLFPMQELLNVRRDKADKYWEGTFAPLLREGVG